MKSKVDQSRGGALQYEMDIGVRLRLSNPGAFGESEEKTVGESCESRSKWAKIAKIFPNFDWFWLIFACSHSMPPLFFSSLSPNAPGLGSLSLKYPFHIEVPFPLRSRTWLCVFTNPEIGEECSTLCHFKGLGVLCVCTQNVVGCPVNIAGSA